MKFGIRTPSLRGRISARTSWKRHVRHSMGFKAPRGYGWVTNPKKALYNRVYNRTTVSVDDLFKVPKSRSAPRSTPILTKAPPALLSYIPLKDDGGVNIAGCVVLMLLLSLPTVGLLFLGLSLKWALILPAAVVCIGLFGNYIVLILQFAAVLIGLIPAAIIIYMFVRIFMFH